MDREAAKQALSNDKLVIEVAKQHRDNVTDQETRAVLDRLIEVAQRHSVILQELVRDGS